MPARRALPVALLLLLSLTLPPAVAAESYFDYDLMDPEGDALDDAGAASTVGAADILRFQVQRTGDWIEQTVTLAAPTPAGERYNEDFTLRVYDSVAPGADATDGILLQHELDNDTVRTNVQDSFTGPNGALDAEVEVSGSTVTFRFAAAELDAFSCFAPTRVEVFYSAGVNGHPEHPPVYASDSLAISPNLCDHPDASTEGFAGTCSPAAAPAAFDQSVSGADGLVTLTSRWEGDRVTDVLTFADAIGTSAFDLRIEHTLEEVDPEDFMAQPKKFTVYVRGGAGEDVVASAVQEGEAYGEERHLFPVKVEIDGKTLSVSWCAAATPALTCHSVQAMGNLATDEGEQRFRTTYPLGEDPCHPLPEGGSSGSSEGSDWTDGASGVDGEGIDTGSASGPGDAKESPGAGLLLVALGLVGAALVAGRRRG